MYAPLSVSGNKEHGTTPAMRNKFSGFTLIELMIVLIIVAIGVALAVPTFTTIIEKRELTAAAEEITALIAFAQSEAIKRNEQVTVSWFTSGGHSTDWCLGVTDGGTACDCQETDPTASDFCAIDDTAYRLIQTDFVDINYEFMHMDPDVGNFAFDPIRGIMTDISDAEIIDGDDLFYIHSDRGSGRTRTFELQIHISITGRTFICTDTDRKAIIGGYKEC